MYAFIAKGVVVGSEITRRLLRKPLSLLGIPIDWIGAACSDDADKYRDLKRTSFHYLDGTKDHPGRVIAGSLGDWIGYAAGGLAGGIVGGALRLPDVILGNLSHSYTKLSEKLNGWADEIGRHKDYVSFDKPNSYMEKVWNLSAVSLGLVFGGGFYGVVKLVEFIFGIRKKADSKLVSDHAWDAGVFIGGMIGGVVGAVLWPVKHLLDKTQELYHAVTNKIRSGIAWIYAVTNNPVAIKPKGADRCFPTHSVAFVNEVAAIHSSLTEQKSSTAVLGSLLGPLKDTAKPKKKVVIVPEAKGAANADISTFDPMKTIRPGINNFPPASHPTTPEASATLSPSLRT